MVKLICAFVESKNGHVGKTQVPESVTSIPFSAAYAFLALADSQPCYVDHPLFFSGQRQPSVGAGSKRSAAVGGQLEGMVRYQFIYATHLYNASAMTNNGLMSIRVNSSEEFLLQEPLQQSLVK